MSIPRKPLQHHKPWRHLSPDEGDIIACRSMLCRWLPPELAEIVLDFAGYWSTHIYSNNEYLDGDAVTGDFDGDPDDGNVVDWCYLMTPPIQTGGRNVIKVEFVTQSHDQGWASFAEYDTYRQSNTWFEAGIFRPSEIESPMLEWVDYVGPVNIAAQRSADPKPGPGYYEEIVNPTNGSKRWRIQRNLTASREVRQHNVVWSMDDVHEASELGDEEDLETGVGRGKTFLQNLKDGDRIGVFARAKQALWRNHVQSVDVLITFKA